MSNSKIKVVGYAQKVVYTDGIEYRNFTPDLVGQQFTDDSNTPLFTNGNFAVTTNMSPKLTKQYVTTSFSNFITLSDLNLNQNQVISFFNNANPVNLNLNKTNLDYYALFGSLREFVRVALEQIITTWPASLYLTPISQTNNGQPITGYTVNNYIFDSVLNESYFSIDTTFIDNKFDLIYTTNGNIINDYGIRNFTINYGSYVIFYNNIEYDVIGYTAATNNTNDICYIKVSGNPFSGQSNNIFATYHIKPNKLLCDEFFTKISDFENYLLNRYITPIYTSVFNYPIKTNDGVIVYVTDKLTWPVSDGYNIDFNTTEYDDYATKLLNICELNDLVSSNLMNRFLVSESITSFDTTPVHLSDLDQDDTGQKMNKTLQIYGVEFDKLNNYIKGISFANTVTYDREDNIPDIYLKNLANTLGWNVISSVFENDVLASYVKTKQSMFSGQSVGLTTIEADIELWRRIILNTPWIWKSKGHRKVVEFFLKFIGIPNGLIKFNEYVYIADKKLDIDLFKKILNAVGLDSNDLSIYPIDFDGYPKPLPNTPDMYFQNDGLWYRETGGSGATIDITTGNNPHVGPYDGGYKYMNQFSCLIPNFSAVTLTSTTSNISIDNLYTNYNNGTFNVPSGTTIDTINFTNNDNIPISECIIFTPTIIDDPKPKFETNNCGCNSEIENNVLSLCIDENKLIQQPVCADFIAKPTVDTDTGLYIFSYPQYNEDGSVFSGLTNNPIPYVSNYTTQNCCKQIGGTPILYEEIVNNVVQNEGYVCCANLGKCGCIIACRWLVDTTYIELPVNQNNLNQDKYLQFTKPDNTKSVVTPDGCHCIPKYTNTISGILDPYTNEIGYACKLNTLGLNDIINNGSNGVIYNYYKDRANGKTSCFPQLFFIG